MKYIKRFLSALLILSMLLALAVPSFAVLPGEEITVNDVSKAMNYVSNSLTELKDTASSADVTTVASVFKSFMGVVQPAAQILNCVNGSVTFLRLLGIISDPTQSKLDSIMTQLRLIDERLSSMDDKLNELTIAMSELKASVEFNTRTEKAILYEGAWRDFEYRYMENGMDKLITQYNSMLRTGLMSWCIGNRTEGSIDNRTITLLYSNTDGEYSLTYTDKNGVPPEISEDDRWLVIPETCLPETFSYDVNTFGDSLADDIAKRITDAIDAGDLSIFAPHNYPLLTAEGVGDITEEDIRALATDAVNTLVYRVAASKVNGDSSFAGEVSRQFSNYCSHLQTSGDGIDAVLKTFYLTHAFEYSAADDIKDFCNRLIILTGTYGMFAANVLGMSHLTTDAEKISAVTQMTSAIEMAVQAKNNGITGNGRYCYITGTILTYTSVSFNASAEIKAHYTMSNTTYKSYKASAPTPSFGNTPGSNAVPCGDTAMIVIENTLLSNGIKGDHAYFNANLGYDLANDYKKIVTGYGNLQTLSFDGKTKLHVKKAFGSYFNDNSTITSLPGKADLDDTVYRKKISGSVYDPSTGTLTSNTTLCALALYGENHFYWITDEGAFMGGPADSSTFADEYSVEKTGSDSSGVFRTHSYIMSNSYNILLSTPRETLGLCSSDGYNPIESFEEDIVPCKYDAQSYETEEKEEVPDETNPGDDTTDDTTKADETQQSSADTTPKSPYTFGMSEENANRKSTLESKYSVILVIAACVLAITAVSAGLIEKKKK